jgi:hypothetical protein
MNTDPTARLSVIRVLRLSGRCADGAERDGGTLFHAVPTDHYMALCGAKPGRRSAGWSAYSGEAVTCAPCLRKLNGGCEH